VVPNGSFRCAHQTRTNNLMLLEVVMRFCVLMTTDDLARWEPCGIPSTWHSPTTRRPGGSPRRNRQRPHVALPPGRRVVALEEDATPCPHQPSSARTGDRSSWRSARPARACLLGTRCVWRCSAAGRTPTRGSAVGTAVGLWECRVTLVDVRWRRVTWLVLNLHQGAPRTWHVWKIDRYTVSSSQTD
jgi:hypothetical protein